MRVFALADLHLDASGRKPMDVFGEHWADHASRIAAAWDALVGADDVVLCPGDLSWAARLDDAAADLAWIGRRPGVKVLGRGNHDYWWSSITKVRAALPPRALALQNDALDLGEVVVAGSRGWDVPGGPAPGPVDEKVYRRELQRLETSLAAGRRLAAGRPLLAAVHYPPLLPGGGATGFSDLLEEHGAALCVYGHLHGPAAHADAVEGEVRGVHYRCVAADFVGFTPVEVWPLR